jgi:cobalamin synthase
VWQHNNCAVVCACRWCDHSPPFLMRSMMHSPLLGAAIGFWGAVFFNAAAVLFPPAVAAAASTLATVHITGCFHEDGLADVFDGFGGEPFSSSLSVLLLLLPPQTILLSLSNTGALLCLQGGGAACRSCVS